MKRFLSSALVFFCGFVAALIVAALWSRVHPANGAGSSSADAKLAAAAAAEAGSKATVANGEVRLSAAEKKAWTDLSRVLQSGDLKAALAALRAAGFPPKTIRAVIAALLDEQYAERRRKIIGDQQVPPYWKAGSMMSSYTSGKMSELRTLDREKQDALAQLLGADAMVSETERYFMQRQYGDLAQEKVLALQRIKQDYGELQNQVFSESGGILLPWDREKLEMIKQEQEKDIAALLTPEELQQMNLRSSSTAQQLQYKLAGFDPTEQEYLTLYSLQKQFDDKNNTPFWLNSVKATQRMADQKALDEQIKEALGAERYVQYQQATDSSFKAASRIVASLNLPADNANQVWNLQNDYKKQATAISGASDLTPEQKRQQMVEFGKQTEQQLSTLLTPAGLNAYKQSGGGNWVRTFGTGTPVRMVPAGGNVIITR